MWHWLANDNEGTIGTSCISEEKEKKDADSGNLFLT